MNCIPYLRKASRPRFRWCGDGKFRGPVKGETDPPPAQIPQHRISGMPCQPAKWKASKGISGGVVNPCCHAVSSHKVALL